MADVACTIIGGGVVGRAIALSLAQDGWSDVALIERCPKDRVENQSTRNSGVIHAGIYYKRDQRPLKAQLCVRGNALLYEFCREHDVAHVRTGKLVIATNARQASYLRGILHTARDNRVPGARLISASEAKALAPNIQASQALLVPSSGIVDSAAYLGALRHASTAHSLFGTEVVSIRQAGSDFEIATRAGGRSEVFSSSWVVNAAGASADEIANMIDPHCGFSLVPARGESAKFYNKRSALDIGGMNIYPVPSGYYANGSIAQVGYSEFLTLLRSGTVTETLGVHLTPTLGIDGAIASTTTIGPMIRSGVRKDDLQHDLYKPAHYLSRVSEFFPSLTLTDIKRHQCGIQARMPGQLDWHIASSAKAPRFINVLGIDSPGMTASLAIGRHVVSRLMGRD